MSERENSNAELDEIFKDDPNFQETKRRLAAMEARDIVNRIYGNASTEQYPANATDEQKKIIRAAREAAAAYNASGLADRKR